MTAIIIAGTIWIVLILACWKFPVLQEFLDDHMTRKARTSAKCPVCGTPDDVPCNSTVRGV